MPEENALRTVQPTVGLFAKPVEAGRVKTRLCPPFTPGEAADLYAAFLTDIARMLGSETRWRWEVYSTHPEGQRATWPENAPVPAAWPRQTGEDLGARMHAALSELLDDGGEAAVLTGSDHPSLPATLIHGALDALEKADVVLGPSFDGGYYLVGLTRPQPDLFHKMTWSDPGVFAETMHRIRSLGLTASVLPPWYDVDTIEDLQFLKAHVASTFKRTGVSLCPTTLRALGPA